jgi:DNA-binding NarL/FixJ family response regulator
MRAACEAAYPDPTHYLRIHIKRLVSHSNRVTAAVALRAAGLSIEDIAYRLRWKAASVETYLRECYQSIGDVTQKAITGAADIAAHAA